MFLTASLTAYTNLLQGHDVRHCLSDPPSETAPEQKFV
jgi:hypothetical protein